jgi:hypothetical protein
MTVETGHFAVLRHASSRVGDDQRIQATVIAFAFGALIVALIMLARRRLGPEPPRNRAIHRHRSGPGGQMGNLGGNGTRSGAVPAKIPLPA